MSIKYLLRQIKRYVSLMCSKCALTIIVIGCATEVRSGFLKASYSYSMFQQGGKIGSAFQTLYDFGSWNSIRNDEERERHIDRGMESFGIFYSTLA